MIMKTTVLIALGLIVAGCAQNKPRVVSSPYASGKTKVEPVFYNGKRYTMKFRYIATQDVYDVNISGKGGRLLGGKSGDQTIVSDVASSAIRHFACARTQKARIVPGTISHTGSSWNMKARCGAK